jgi:DNA-binding PadR family transcriptional regulator
MTRDWGRDWGREFEQLFQQHGHGGPGAGGWAHGRPGRAGSGRQWGPPGRRGGGPPPWIAGLFGMAAQHEQSRGPRARRGDVRMAILAVLAEGPLNGYQVIQEISERTDGGWRPSPGSVYPTLQQLVDEELIASNGDGRRTEYELTDAGKAYVTENAESMKAAWDATPGRSESVAAFHESIAKLMGVVQQVRFAATDAQRTAAAEKLDEARRALYLILAD